MVVGADDEFGGDTFTLGWRWSVYSLNFEGWVVMCWWRGERKGMKTSYRKRSFIPRVGGSDRLVHGGLCVAR